MKDAAEGQDHDGDRLSLGQRIWRGFTGAAGVVGTAIGIGGAGKAAKAADKIADAADNVSDANRAARVGQTADNTRTTSPSTPTTTTSPPAQTTSKGARAAEDIAEENRRLSGGCFFAGTLVAVEHGHKPIENVWANEKVWAFDVTTAQWRLARVVETYATDYAGEMVRLRVAGQWVESTSHHPVWVVEGEGLAERPEPDHVKEASVPGAIVPGRWVDAADLLVGDVLLVKPNERATIEAIDTQYVAATVYNFQVEGLHTYAVSFASVLVHNNVPCGQPGFGDKAAQDVLPGSLKREFPSQYLTWSLNDIKAALSGATGTEKTALQKAKKLLEQTDRLLNKPKG